MTPLPRRLRTILLLIPPALLLACTDVIETPVENTGGSGFPTDTFNGGGNPGGGGDGTDGSPSGRIIDDTGSVAADVSADASEPGDVAAPPDADSAQPGADTTGPSQDTADAGAVTEDVPVASSCSELEASYGVALASAKACTADLDCKLRRPADVAACECDTWVTAAGAGAVDAIAQQFDTAGCTVCEAAPECAELDNARCIEGVCATSAAPVVDCQVTAGSYKAEISKAKACTDSTQCRLEIEGALVCGCPIFVNDTWDITAAKALAAEFHKGQCSEGEGCAACGEPLVGVCSGGKCITKTKAP